MKFNRRNIGMLLASGAIVGGSFTGCKKGEDDPAISLKSRKGRLTGNWEVKSWKATYSGKEVDYLEGFSEDSYTLSFEAEFDFDKKGDFEFRFTFSYSDGTESFSLTSLAQGEWEFNGDKSELHLDYDNDALFDDSEYDLIRLSNKEITMEAVVDNRLITMELEKIK